MLPPLPAGTDAPDGVPCVPQFKKLVLYFRLSRLWSPGGILESNDEPRTFKHSNCHRHSNAGATRGALLGSTRVTLSPDQGQTNARIYGFTIFMSHFIGPRNTQATTCADFSGFNLFCFFMKWVYEKLRDRGDSLNFS